MLGMIGPRARTRLTLCRQASQTTQQTKEPSLVISGLGF